MSNVPVGYKQTEVGVIPEDWVVRNLESVSVISRLAGAEYTSVWVETSDGEITALRGFNIGKGRIIEKDFVRISNELSLKLKRSRLCAGDVVYPCVGSIGNAAVITEDSKYHIQQNIARITPNPAAISSRYLANYLMSFLGEREVGRFNASSSQPSVLVGSLRQYRVPLPPTKAEQEAIAEALSDTDALIESLEQLIAKKRHLKQGAMQELLTGKKRLPGFGIDDDAAIVGATGRSPLPNVPHGWEVKRLGDVLKVRHGKSQHNVEIIGGKYPILASGGEIGRSNNYLYDKPSVLIGRKGTIDVPQFVDTPFWTIDTLFFTEIAPEADAKFIFYKFNTITWRSYNEASGVPSLSASRIENIDFSCPPQPEQTAIATTLSDMDAEIGALETKLAKTRQLKQGMMHNLLTGRIRLL